MAASKRDRLMTSGEWEDFWLMIESKHTVHGPPAKVPHIMQPARMSVRLPSSPPTPSKWHDSAPIAKGRHQRSNRCGSCAACRAQDCGRCKNCRDKPRFGGPGIKKKACLARICHRADENGSDDDAATIALEAPTSVSGRSPQRSSRRSSRVHSAPDEPAPDVDHKGADDGCEPDDTDPVAAGWLSDGSTNVSRIASVVSSLMASPAIRPASPPQEVKDPRGERLPLYPLCPSPTHNLTTSLDVCTGVDVLSMMASQIPSG
mmetsp:Transcript_47709/g.95239  ORF Transcript_47709/g.95239 Transcript_47709/m.95239 type:complete len:261 (+) Transcript_47709:65-847(+)